jgi:hypothetical protein
MHTDACQPKETNFETVVRCIDMLKDFRKFVTPKYALEKFVP